MNKLAIAGVVLAFWAGWFVNGWRLNGEIEKMQKEAIAESAKKYEERTETVNKAASEYVDNSGELQAEITDLKRKLKNAKANTRSCSVDDSRLQYVKDAIRATNAAVR